MMHKANGGISNKLKAVLLDCEGTLFFKGQLIPGAADCINYLRQSGLEFLLLTNNDSKAPESIWNTLTGLGLEIGIDQLFTPVHAVSSYMESEEARSYYPLLSKDLEGHFQFSSCSEYVDGVIVGDCREVFSYQKINEAFRHLMNGADLLVLQKGRYFVRADGLYMDTGGIVKMLEFCSGKEAILMGKPSDIFYNAALNRVSCSPVEVVVVGDDLSTDIAGARNIGAPSVLLKTGKFLEGDLQNNKYAPDAVLDSILNLPDLLDSYRV